MIHIIVLLSLLLPIPAPIVTLSIGVIYGLTKHCQLIIKHIIAHKSILAIFIVALIGSTLTNNSIGILVTALLFGLWIYFIVLYKEITPFLFEGLTSVLLIGSWFHAIYALLQHLKIFFGPDYHAWHESMISWRDGRADSVFLNPNYYAFMCVVYILIALYKAQTSQLTWRYYMTICVNILGVIFTQSRTALFVIFIVIFAFYYHVLPETSRTRLRLTAVIAILVSPLLQLLPRFDLGTIVSHLIDIRFEIWQVSIDAFFKQPLFGHGPFAYRMLYPLYNSYPTQHTHNLYVDSLLNYGLIGSLLLVIVLVKLIKRIRPLKMNHPALYALGMGLITLVFTHGILDVSIIFVHTLSIVGFLLIYLLKSDVH